MITSQGPQREENVIPDGYIYGLRPGKKVAYDISIAHTSVSALSVAPLHALPELLAATEREKKNTESLMEQLKRVVMCLFQSFLRPMVL